MLGTGTTETFFRDEFSTLELKDKRLVRRAIQVGVCLQKRLTSCIKRLFIDKKDMRQAYDFFS
ncbi:transposase DNA-binding-containing protein [Legionella sp. W10-070]|uniref:IS4/Tn5 family transposase DNA-binding protein n=1 Tax=Legionella sp. W10-070 TaxID=1117709 RepID=UPI001055CE46|nr:transposase DNA-binding-containing protein [Legionella sp. W10-070]